MQDILLFENLIEKKVIDSFREFMISQAPWTRGGNSGFNNENGMYHWACPFENMEESDLYYTAIDMFDLLIQRIEQNSDLKFNPDKVQQIVLNCYEYGNYSGPHKDNLDDENAISMILYLNTDWKPEWGGNTEFYDEAMQRVTSAVSPIGGDVVVFPGNLWHRGGDVSRICTKAKYSITYQGFLL